MIAFAFGIAASGAWGFADFLGGLATRKVSGLLVVLISEAIGVVALLALLAIGGDLRLPSAVVLPALIAGVTGGLGVAVLYRALAVGTMSIVAPIAATAVSVPVLYGLVRGEHPGPVQAIGIGVAFVGVILVSQEEDLDRAERRAAHSGVMLALGAAALIGVSLAAISRASDSGALLGSFWIRIASVLCLALFVAASRPPLKPARAELSTIVWLGLLDTAGMCFYAAATTHGLLSLVSVLAAVFPVVTVLLARFVLHERIRRIQEVGILVTLTGVGLLASGL